MDRGLLAVLAGFTALAVVVLIAVWLTVRQDSSAALVRHALEVENRLSSVLSLMQDAETGQRGYLLTGQKQYLQPYNNALTAIEPRLAELTQAVSDNPRQTANAAHLQELARARVTIASEVLGRYDAGEPVASLAARLERGRQLMDRVRLEVAKMKAEEERLLRLRTARANRESALLRITLLASGMAVIALGALAFNDGRRRLSVAISASQSLAIANARLEAEAAIRQEAQAQVQQLQKLEAVGQLTGGIAHDFNNMLAIVIGSLDLAKRRLKTDLPKAEMLIDNALDGAGRAAQLTARLLAFSRQQALAPQVLDANKLVGGMSEMLRRTIGENLRVETVLAGGVWRTHADPAQLENTIVNLCVNARDAMPDGGRLTIETSNTHLDDAYAAAADLTAGQYVMVSVSDTGAGMSAEVIARAFEPFYTTKGVGRGTGLGLSQVHGFVKQSHGHVKIYSEPGVGTTIKVYLPRTLDEAEVGDPVLSTGELPRGVGEIILVVEDEDRVRHVSVDALRDLGYAVVQAADAEQALGVLALQPRIDLLFTDVVMPGANGRKLADQARSEQPGLKVLFTTGYTKNAIVHNGMLDADVDVLAKPFTIEQLARKVRQVLDA